MSTKTCCFQYLRRLSMFTFYNLFQGVAGLSLIMLVLHLVAGGGLGGAVIWTLGAVVFLCAANACRPKKG